MEYIKKEDAISKILIEFTKREENEKFMCTCADVKQTCADILDGLQTYSFPDSAENKGDLIRRQAVEDITWEEPSYSDPLNVLTEVREKVRALPSVENNGEDSKVAKGQWIKFENGYKCSECGHIMDKVLSVSGNLIYQYSNYCPDCGADMRDEDASGIFKGQTSISLEGLDKWSIEEAGKIKLKGDKAE